LKIYVNEPTEVLTVSKAALRFNNTRNDTLPLSMERTRSLCTERRVNITSLSGVEVITRWHSGREVRWSRPGHATILLGNTDRGQVVYSHCLHSLVRNWGTKGSIRTGPI